MNAEAADAVLRETLRLDGFEVFETVAHAPECGAPQGSCSPRCRFLPRRPWKREGDSAGDLGEPQPTEDA